MTYTEESELISTLIIDLSCLLHHRRTLHYMHENLLEVSPAYVQHATFTLDLLEGTEMKARKNLTLKVPLLLAFIKEMDDIKGPDYLESLPDRNSVSNKQCPTCGKKFECKSSKQVFCSTRCRVSHHRHATKP